MKAVSLQQDLLDSLGAAIARGEIEPGTILTLDELGERYGVSRTVVRDAVKALEAQHLVRPQRRVGIAVLPPSEWDVFSPAVIRWRLGGPDRMRALHEISELRGGIEPHAAALAARRATPEQTRRLEQAALAMAQMARVPDLLTYLDHDVTFHSTLLQASGNPMLASLDEVVAEVLSGRTQHALMPRTPNPVAVDLHRQVAEAIARHDAAEAERLMREIVIEAQVGADEMFSVPDAAFVPDQD